MRKISFFIIIAVTASLHWDLRAAEVESNSKDCIHPGCVSIKGEIQSGDFEKFVRAFEAKTTTRLRLDGEDYVEIEISSPGGGFTRSLENWAFHEKRRERRYQR